MSPWPGAIACVLAALFLVAVIGTVREYIARRNEKQLEAERVMRRGWKTLRRYGLLPEDLQ